MKVKKKTIAWALVLCMVAGIFSGICWGGKSGVSQVQAKEKSFSKLHVEGTHLCNEKGKTVQLRGISTHGLAWFPQYVNKKLFKELHDKWGANAVRLALYTEEYAGYCTGDKNSRKELRKLVRKGVKYATEAGLYVIIDWHILSDGNPKKNQSYAKSFFRMMSKEFKDQNNVIYELCNEPNGGTDWKTIKSYANKIIPIIRKNDEDAIVIVGTPTWSQDLEQALESPLKYDNVMYTFHFYASTHKADMRKRVKAVLKAKLPVFVTEFGISEASGNGRISKSGGKKWLDLFDQYGVSYIAFNLSNKDESCALIKSSCQKVNGLKRSDLSAFGKWYYDLLRKKAGKK